MYQTFFSLPSFVHLPFLAWYHFCGITNYFTNTQKHAKWIFAWKEFSTITWEIVFAAPLCRSLFHFTLLHSSKKVFMSSSQPATISVLSFTTGAMCTCISVTLPWNDSIISGQKLPSLHCSKRFLLIFQELPFKIPKCEWIQLNEWNIYEFLKYASGFPYRKMDLIGMKDFLSLPSNRFEWNN